MFTIKDYVVGEIIEAESKDVINNRLHEKFEEYNEKGINFTIISEDRQTVRLEEVA